MLNVIIAGGRDFNDYALLAQTMNQLRLDGKILNRIAIVSGMARGADSVGVQFANSHNILVKEFPAQWDKFGKSAGYRRNAEMAKEADVLVAFWDGKSKGTEHMINHMKTLNKHVHVINY